MKKTILIVLLMSVAFLLLTPYLHAKPGSIPGEKSYTTGGLVMCDCTKPDSKDCYCHT